MAAVSYCTPFPLPSPFYQIRCGFYNRPFNFGGSAKGVQVGWVGVLSPFLTSISFPVTDPPIFAWQAWFSPLLLLFYPSLYSLPFPVATMSLFSALMSVSFIHLFVLFFIFHVKVQSCGIVRLISLSIMLSRFIYVVKMARFHFFFLMAE